VIESVFRKLDELSKVDVVNLLNVIFEDYALRMQWNLESFDRDVHENSISMSDSFVMEMKGEPVGIVPLSFRDKRARIDLMGVIPSFRRSGIGFQMVDESVKICKWKGSDSVVLEVLKKDSRAMGFYRKFGFRERRDLITFFLRKCGKNGLLLRKPRPM
jgi:ribosomal protein S18 acetylase RimI-like enzyme